MGRHQPVSERQEHARRKEMFIPFFLLLKYIIPLKIKFMLFFFDNSSLNPNFFVPADLQIKYTCQLFLRYKREIFVLGVLGFFKTTRSFPKVPEEVRSLPKQSEDFRRRPKSAEGEVIESQS